MRRSAAAAIILVLSAVAGCTRSRTFTIYTKPGDARLLINGVDRGSGPITQRFDFAGSGGKRRITAVREGYETTHETVTANTPLDTVVIEMRPIGPKVIVSVEPVAAMVRVNGRLVQPTPVRQTEITLDPNQPDQVFNITAEQTGYARETITVSGKSPQGYRRILLRPLREETAVARADTPRAAQSQPVRTQPSPSQPAQTQPRVAPPAGPPREMPPREAPVVRGPQPLKRDIVIRTEPPDVPSEIFIGDEKWGDREVRLGGYEFQRDPATGRSVPQQVRATAPGYEGGRAMMRFEDEKPLYVIALGNRRKEVRITTEPPGATVVLDGKTVPRDRNGVAAATLAFPPKDPPGKPTTYSATAEKEDEPGWEPGAVAIGWDDGKAEYSIKLSQARTMKVPALRVVAVHDGPRGWRGEARRYDTLATRDTSEGPGRPETLPLIELPADAILGSVTASPEGTAVLYTELISPDDKALRSRMRLLNSDGTPGESLRSDGQNLDVMPSFTPDGTQIVFTSDRSGEGLDIWRLRLSGPGAGEAKRLARGGEKAALWPMIDASPRPRLFYEEFLKPGAARSGGASEIHMVELEAEPPTNTTLAAGTRPRASPRADAVVFTAADPNTGNRDIYLLSDKNGVPLGGDPVNLTNTPDVDECDPAWSRTGGKIAYASNAGADESNRRNYDLYVLTVSAPQRPTRVTYNGSLDDSPAWDATGRSLFFRSNRGGKWGVWKVHVP